MSAFFEKELRHFIDRPLPYGKEHISNIQNFYYVRIDNKIARVLVDLERVVTILVADPNETYTPTIIRIYVELLQDPVELMLATNNEELNKVIVHKIFSIWESYLRQTNPRWESYLHQITPRNDAKTF